jgi:predicted AAA+ superfamily ATPase
MQELPLPNHYALADDPGLRDRIWIEQQWEVGRQIARSSSHQQGALLVLDEVHKVSGWSDVVKRLWDEDTATGTQLKVILLGSSPLLIQSGIGESLAGRFERLWVPHWSFAEMHEAFGWSVEQFIFFGGYPRAAVLVDDWRRWSRYIIDSLIDTTVSRDVLQMSRVHKPALLRQLFQLGCHYSGQILSYQKMLGQLQEAGNTTTLAHYLHLLEGAGLLQGISKYSGSEVRKRASSPKLQVLNTALMSAPLQQSLVDVRSRSDIWGRLVESAIGAHLLNGSKGSSVDVFYWRERNHEVDFVLRQRDLLVAIEVKSGGRKTTLPGMQAFCKAHRVQRKLLVGGQGIPLETFLAMEVEELLS